MSISPDSYPLGVPTAEYKTAGNRRLLFGFAILLLIGGGFAMLYGVASPYLSDLTDERPPLVIIGGLVVLLGWALVESWLRNRDLRVLTFPDGLMRFQYGKSETCRWDEIVSIWQSITKRYTNGIYMGTTHLYTIQKSDNKQLKFGDALKDVEQLGNLLQNEVTTRQLPAALSRYNSGGTVNFGNVSVSPVGLTRGDQTLSWSEIQGVQIQKGFVSIKKQGKWLNWAKISVAKIPNLLVFLTLVDRIVGVNTKK